MSLIFEALKKLDKEKQVPERGFVVVAQAPWPASRRRRLGWLALGTGFVLVAGLVGFALSRRPSVPGAAASPRPVNPTTPVAAAVAAAPAEVGSQVPPSASLPTTPTEAAAGSAPIWRRPSPVAPAERPAVPESQAPPPQVATPAPRSTVPPRQDLQLQAITERDGQPVAMVSGHLVREGDSFDGVRILKIGPTEVEIEVEGRRRVLRF